jgi:hypothetical protein
LYGTGWAGTPAAPAPAPVGGRRAGRCRHQIDFISQHGWLAWTRKLTEVLLPPPAPPPIPAGCLGPVVSADEYIRLTQGSAVTVGVNRFPSFRHPRRRPGTYSRLRDIEAPMLGACYLTEWTEELPQLYDLGVEIETYRDARELAEKIAVLRADPGRRRRLRVAGQRRALARHTIGQSLVAIVKALGLSYHTA